MPARMKAIGNFSDASVERFYSVRINRMSPSDTVDIGRPVTRSDPASKFRGGDFSNIWQSSLITGSLL